MRYRTHRLRRLAAAGVLGVGMTAGVLGVTAGVASAQPGATTITSSAGATTHVASTGTGQAAAAFTVSVGTRTGAQTAFDQTFVVHVASTSGTAVWDGNPTCAADWTTSNALTCTATVTTTTHNLTVEITGAETLSGKTLAVHITGDNVTTTSASGEVKVTIPSSSTITQAVTTGVEIASVSVSVSGPGATTITSSAGATTHVASTGTGLAAAAFTVSVGTRTGAQTALDQTFVVHVVSTSGTAVWDGNPTCAADWTTSNALTCTATVTTTTHNLTVEITGAETLSGKTLSVHITADKVTTKGANGDVEVTIPSSSTVVQAVTTGVEIASVSTTKLRCPPERKHGKHPQRRRCPRPRPRPLPPRHRAPKGLPHPGKPGSGHNHGSNDPGSHTHGSESPGNGKHSHGGRGR